MSVSRRQRTPALRAEVARIVALKIQIPKYDDVARAHGVSVQVVRHMISEGMPAQRTKIRSAHR
jgi:hypothetical protein